MRFDTAITLSGPLRRPAQMLADQAYDGHASVHDEATAASMGLSGAPIEGPTHFSQFDPLAFLLWGREWFERGCVSSHFRTMVVDSEEVKASLTVIGEASGQIHAEKADGSPVLIGTVSIGPTYGDTELDRRLASLTDPRRLFIVDQLEIGMRQEGEVVTVDHDTPNGMGYPFSLAQKLAKITESHPWYTKEQGHTSPWGRAILPMEMISVLAHKSGPNWPVRTPSLGLFLDMEIRLLAGPIFVGTPYRLTRELIGLSQSRRTESYWTRTTLTDADSGKDVALVTLHSGVFKDSYGGHPA